MSYSIAVKVTDGTAVVSVSGPAPDGGYTLSGHIDEHREDIIAERVTTAGQLAARTSGTVYKGV